MTNKINIEWIGTGSGLNPKLGNTSFLVYNESGRVLLVDAGSTVPLRLLETGKLNGITDVILTHAHADHIGGIEALSFMNYFAYRKRDEGRPNLYVATDEFAHNLWNRSLVGGLEKIQDDDAKPFDATLETYFKVNVGKNICIRGLPEISMFPTLHVFGMENYGLRFSNGIYYSGDTVELPPHDPKTIFQDCQFFEGKTDVHVPYDKLVRKVPAEVREKTYLVHLGSGWENKDPRADGFAGFVMPGQKFEF